MKKGEITVFLSLVFLLIISFVGALIESASVQILKNEKRARLSLAMESVFAEFQKEVLEEYDLFVLEETYETGQFHEKNLINRLGYYGAGERDNEVERYELLTDMSGRAFCEQAVRYIECKLGIDGIRNQKEQAASWEEQQACAKDYQEQEEETNHSLETMLEESQESLPDENNPIPSVSNLKKSSLLQIVVSNPEQISDQNLVKDNLPSVRRLRRGKGKFPEQSDQDDAIGKVFLIEYLLEHFSDKTQKDTKSPLMYEVEYLLEGYGSDQKNLEAVLKKILAMRFTLNYGYLLTDDVKKAEAEGMALALCTLLTVPGITEVVKQALLLAWAYGESILELRTIMEDGKVPIVKNGDNWQLQLSELANLGNAQEWQETPDSEEGMSYRDYLRGLLFLEKKEVLSMRALDLIECSINAKLRSTFFRVDHCITRLEVYSNCKLRRGIRYEFRTYFGYQ